MWRKWTLPYPSLPLSRVRGDSQSKVCLSLLCLRHTTTTITTTSTNATTTSSTKQATTAITTVISWVGGALGVATEVGAGEELVGLRALQIASNLGRGLVEGGSPVLLLAAGEEVKRCNH